MLPTSATASSITSNIRQPSIISHKRYNRPPANDAQKCFVERRHDAVWGMLDDHLASGGCPVRRAIDPPALERDGCGSGRSR